MPSAIRLLDFRPVRIRPFEPRSLRMDLPRTRRVRVDFQAWRARLRSLDLPSIGRPLVRPLRPVHPRPTAAGVVAVRADSEPRVGATGLPGTRVAPSEPRMRRLYAGEGLADGPVVPRRHRWTGFEYDGRGGFHGKRRAIIRPLSREELMSRIY